MHTRLLFRFEFTWESAALRNFAGRETLRHLTDAENAGTVFRISPIRRGFVSNLSILGAVEAMLY